MRSFFCFSIPEYCINKEEKFFLGVRVKFMNILQPLQGFFIKRSIHSFPNEIIKRNPKGIRDFFSGFNGGDSFTPFILTNHLPANAAVVSQFSLVPVFLFAEVANNFTCIYRHIRLFYVRKL